MSSIEVDAGWHHRAIFEHPSELIAVLDAVRDDAGRVVDWRYRDANGATLALLQRARDAVVGQLISAPRSPGGPELPTTVGVLSWPPGD